LEKDRVGKNLYPLIVVGKRISSLEGNKKRKNLWEREKKKKKHHWKLYAKTRRETRVPQ